MKVLVTGASGFIGREIVSELSGSNFEVIKAAGSRCREKDFYKINIADSLDVKNLEEIGEVDALIHSAGLAHQFGKTSKEDFFAVNVKGTENICEAAVKLRAKQFILLSSVSVYGNRDDKKQAMVESAECRPAGFYAESKLESEIKAREVCGENKIPLTILRPATVIGEGDSGNVARLIESIDNKRFIWIGKGENSKSLVYKRDVARACAAVLSKNTYETEIFNVSAEPLEMKEIVTLIEENLGRKVPGFYFPEGILRSFLQACLKIGNAGKLRKALETIDKWVAEDVYPADKLREAYNFAPETSAAEALRREVNWYKNNK